MAHLSRFRKGWQSQNIARAILYTFSFVSEPIYSADDIGADFFCTLFNIETDQKNEVLIPSNSFIIQIKSESPSITTIDISKYLPLISKMELPFFIGMVNKKTNQMTIYSGELIPYFYTFRIKDQVCDKLIAKFHVIEKPPDGDSWLNYKEWSYKNNDNLNSYTLLFPKIAVVSLNQKEEAFQNNVSIIKKHCHIISQNLATFNRKEYIFKDPDNCIVCFTNPDSDLIITSNIQSRLAEMFFHIFHICENGKVEEAQGLFEVYYQMYLLLDKYTKKHNIDNPQLNKMVKLAESAVMGKAKTTVERILIPDEK